MTVYDVLNEIKTRWLDKIDVNTCKIGLEPNLSPSDYPIIRIVAESNSLSHVFDRWSEDINFNIYCGDKIDSKIGMDKIYKYLYDLETKIKVSLHNQQLKDGGLIRFVNTISDDDTLKNFKILCLSFEIKEVRLE